MKYEIVKPRKDSAAVLELFLRENTEGANGCLRPCVIVCPGGAYVFCGDRDSEPNALAYLGEGFQACVLRYTIRPDDATPPLHCEPMRDVAASIRYVRLNAQRLGVDPRRIALVGVSAGAHAAACAEVFWNDPARLPGNGDTLGRPDALVLCYPVVTGGEYAHRQSLANLTGQDTPCPENDAFSVERFVTADTRPMFLWQPVGDETVPSENAMLLAQALQAHSVPFELHLYAQGWHGIGLADGEVGSALAHVASWFPLSVQFLLKTGFGNTQKGE